MLSAEGCKRRRQQLWERLEVKPEGGRLLLADPIHLMYLANFWVDPFSLGAGFGGCLVLREDGHATLLHDDRLPASVAQAHAHERQEVAWYDGFSPARGVRQLAMRADCQRLVGAEESNGFRVHDAPSDPLAPAVVQTLATLRRRKDPDELDLLRRCMKAGEAGHVWARHNIKPGMTELEVYAGVSAACTLAAGRAVIVYGDFAVSPGPARRGGPPTERVLEPGDMMILDFSVVLGGYRSDLTNTLVVGQPPTPDQQRLYDLCMAAMAAGERQLRGGAAALDVFEAVNAVFDRVGLASSFAHHAGHGIGLTHPEAPFFVPGTKEILVPGDVVTLEPGLYVTGVGGIRIEHNYHVTETGCERLSNHTITLTGN